MKQVDLSSLPQADVTDMLRERDGRKQRQNAYLRGGDLNVLLCFTLNIPGPCKVFPLADLTFREGVRLLTVRLDAAGLSPRLLEQTQTTAGHCAYFSAAGSPKQAKAAAVAVEQTERIGRLFDIDVLRPDGTKLSRTELGLGERGCMVCGAPGANCSRSRRHSVTVLQQEAVCRMSDYFDRHLACRIAQDMTRALLYELAATPKPGLVDRANAGAHRDMDFHTFLDSACALTPYFYQAALRGLRYDGPDMTGLFAQLQWLGLEAEQDMYRATGGVNTHKGAVFSAGLLCGAAGFVFADASASPGIDAVLAVCADLARAAAADAASKADGPMTNGRRILQKYALSGIRGEVLSGFASVRRYALPILRQALRDGADTNSASVLTLLHLIAHVDDTNMIARSDLETVRTIQDVLRRDLAAVCSAPDALSLASCYDRRFIARNISAGGCADLLGITWMLIFLEKMCAGGWEGLCF